MIKYIRQGWLDFLYRHPSLTFVLMGLSFLLFGFYSVNLFVLLKANVELIVEYGMMAMADGAAQQLAELLFAAYLSMLFFLGFKVCERVLVTRLTRRLKSAPQRADERKAARKAARRGQGGQDGGARGPASSAAASRPAGTPGA